MLLNHKLFEFVASILSRTLIILLLFPYLLSTGSEINIFHPTSRTFLIILAYFIRPLLRSINYRLHSSNNS